MTTIDYAEFVIKLPKRFKAKWLAALRSGEIKQARGMLCDLDGMCCLGVACHVAGTQFIKDTGMLTKTLNGSIYLPNKGDVPDNVLTTLCESDNGGVTTAGHLSEMNDDGENSFAEIADWIEEHL